MKTSIPTDLSEALATFQSEADQIIKDFFHKTEGSRAPQTIYHYTNDVGLKGILESGKLWFTDIFNLNDPSELRHGFGVALDVWNGRAFYGRPGADTVASAFRDFYENAAFYEAAHYFTCSFSGDGDELGQWRAYADDGRGFALAFDRQALEVPFIQKGISPFAQTFPLTYDDAQLRNLQERIAEKALPFIDLLIARKLDEPTLRSIYASTLAAITGRAMNAALFFKHESYRSEQEYRFLEAFPADAPPEGTRVRTRPYALVRYKEFDWRTVSPKALKEIVIGPSVDRDKAALFAKDCLRYYSFKNVKVTQSPIPYRGA